MEILGNRKSQKHGKAKKCEDVTNCKIEKVNKYE